MWRPAAEAASSCSASGPMSTITEEVDRALAERWRKVQLLQSRRSSDPMDLVALASLVLEDLDAGEVTVDRFDSGSSTDIEAAAAQRLRSPVTVRAEESAVIVPIDQTGQIEDALRFQATNEAVRLLHLGPLADTATDDSTVDAFSYDGPVTAIAAVYPYGPVVSALIEGARSLGVSAYEIPADVTVDRVDDGGAAALVGDVDRIEPPREVRTWQELVADVRKPWRALNVGDQRRTQDAARIVRRSDVAAFRDRHSGERCVIIGNGPSLNKLDLTAIAGEVTFGVNSIYLASEQMGFVPTYYMVEDTLVMKENVQDILDYPVKQKFFPSRYAEHFGDDPEGVTFFDMDGSFYSEGSSVFGVPRFSDDFARRGYCGQSVTILNLQLAFHMGFKEVYMIGMDFSYVIPDSVIREGNHLTSTEDDPNHFHPKYFGAGKTWKDPKLDRVLASYQMAKRVYEQHGREIINATAGGALELFRRADYHEVFGGTPPSGSDG